MTSSIDTSVTDSGTGEIIFLLILFCCSPDSWLMLIYWLFLSDTEEGYNFEEQDPNNDTFVRFVLVHFYVVGEMIIYLV